ncbi:MAG: glycoside hydrolase, partial [Chitinivibrionales bacterium]|nr:glycoside hydrolase [Chitinivibrionales bacterium]MBD3395382.1 glycoside hydrolase [Chitinivibrionales bacterium]
MNLSPRSQKAQKSRGGVIVCRAYLVAALAAAGSFAQLVTDPLPYEPIANPLPDTLDQLYRDSATIQIGRVRVNQAGYRPQDDKYFYYVGSSASSFDVLDHETGNVVAAGTMATTNRTTSGQITITASNNAQRVTNGDTRYTMASETVAGTVFEGKLPALSPGVYRVRVGADESTPFVVDDGTYGMVRDAVVKFFGIQRSGDNDSWFHPASHMLDGPNGDGSLTGGCYDCGDHLKEGITQSFAMALLGLTAATLDDRDADHYDKNHAITYTTDGIPDILYETKLLGDYVLKSYNQAGGSVGAMYTSVGNFGQDHQWWGRPEYQDNMPTSRGGPVREVRNEVGANVVGCFAAGMAFLSRLYAPYDPNYADTCLTIARKLYDYGKAHPAPTATPAYSGAGTVEDDLAIAAVALLWATGERTYLDDICYDATLGTHGNAAFPKVSFEGGWFAYSNVDFSHGSANTDWGSIHVPALWGFYRLVLRDQSLMTSLGVSGTGRTKLIEKTVHSLINNLCYVGSGDQTITLPSTGMSWGGGNSVRYGRLWSSMKTQQEWVWNRYQMGNILEMYCYYDMASWVQGMELPNTPAATDWKAEEVKGVLVRMLDYMLGVNPWDVSMIYGVGDKNFNHPHHRAANPEGKNVPGAFYRYFPPVGALQGGYAPTTSIYDEYWADYYHSEVCLDGAAVTILPVTGLAKEIVREAPDATVRILHVGCDRAIIEIRQDRYGIATVHYGRHGQTPSLSAVGDSSGVVHRIELDPLDRGTTYDFYVVVEDAFGSKRTVKTTNEDDEEVNFTFTTLQSCPDDAEITNVKVCRVTSDSAEIFWYTPNGEFDSKIVYGTTKPPATVHEGDITGHPVNFHYVKIGGLAEKTTYYFYVESGATRDDNHGTYYSFTTPVEHVDFDIRTIRYAWGAMPVLGMVFVNQDAQAYDSLELRVYMRGTEDEMADFGARVDIGIKYNSAGFQDEHFKGVVDGPLQQQKPVKMDDTFDPSDSTYAWYFAIPLGDAEMESGARFRLDIILVKRNLPYNDDLLNEPPTHIPGDGDWSWMPHDKSSGDPVDFGGIESGDKDNLDDNYWNLEVNRYVTVYRKDEFVWGFSPSQSEQVTKKTHYEMTARITSPLQN